MVPGEPREVSPREAEVLAGLAEHRTNAQIAHRLRISVRTVESHVSSLLRKYGVANRAALVALTGQQPSPSARPGHVEGIPVSHTSFIGRRQERQEALAALTHAAPVCLVGPGGVGKTRLAAVLAQAASASFPAGGAFVDLTPVGEGFVLRTVADALGLAERPPQPLESMVAERLALGRSLLVLDNCEHLLDEVGDLVDRLRSDCPQAGILIASRERPGLPGERVITVPPLAGEAETLFLERARAIDPGFAAEPAVVAEVCARLDGLPLAIELAASRVAVLGIDALRVGLQDRLRLLSGARGRPPRHRSLRAVIGWSYDLLEEEERALLRRLAVFAGGFDLAAATALMPGTPPSTTADVIGRLADKSLIGVVGGGRWRLLETIRAFAADRLADSGETEETFQLRLRWAAGTAATLESRLDGNWAPQFDLVADDLRATLADTAAVPDRQAHRLARSLAHLTFARRFHREAIGHYLAAADRARDAEDGHQDLLSAAATAVSIADGPLAFRLLVRAADQLEPADQADPAEHAGPAEPADHVELADRAEPAGLRAAALASALVVTHRYRGADDRDPMSEHLPALIDKASADAAPADPRTAALVATARAWDQDDLELAASAVEAARECGDVIVLLGALDVLTRAHARAGRMRTVQRICRERLTLIEHLPAHEPSAAAEIVDTFHSAARAELCVGDLPAALAVADRAQREDPIGEHPYLSIPKTIRPLALSGRFPEVFQQAPAMWEAWHQAGSPRSAWMSTAICAAALAHGLAGTGEFDLWRSRALEMAMTRDAASSPVLAPFAAFADARVAVHTGAYHQAATLVERAFAPFRVRWYEAYARAAGAELAVVAGLPEAAERVAAAMPYAEQNDWAAACLARTRGILHGDRDAVAEAAERWTSIDARFERACTLRLLPG